MSQFFVRLHPALLIVLLAGTLSAFVRPPSEIEIQQAEAKITFPGEIEFTLQASSDSPIELAELEYGLEVQSCGIDINRATPEDFEPGSTEIDVNWTWDMYQTGSLPPGARLWWRWHLVTADGSEITTDTEELIWLDAVHPWQTVKDGGVAVHWYQGPDGFGQMLLDKALADLERLEEQLGARPNDEVNFYIYGSTEDMRDAVLFEAQWTGGLAYYGHNIILIGINLENLDWGMDTISHELAHLVVHSVVTHCYASTPNWLDEGLATWTEGALDPYDQAALEEAIDDNTLYSIRSLTDSFTEQSDRAGLAYAQSYSIVNYLMSAYGKEQMLAFLESFQAGYSQESALEQAYGLTIDELESKWRASIGASPPTVSLERPSDEIPPMPTVIPISGPPPVTTYVPPPTLTPVPPPPIPPGSPGGGGALSTDNSGLLMVAALFCCGIVAMAAFVGLVVNTLRQHGNL